MSLSLKSLCTCEHIVNYKWPVPNEDQILLYIHSNCENNENYEWPTSEGLNIAIQYIHEYVKSTRREESSQTNVILQYKLLQSILNAICSLIQQS